MNTPGVNERALLEVVAGFQVPNDPGCMAFITDSESVLYAAIVTRHYRKNRRRLRERYVKELLRLSRSVNGKGSEQAANVARNPRAEGEENVLSKLLGRPTSEQKGV